MTIFDNLLTANHWTLQYGEIQCLQLTENRGINKSQIADYEAFNIYS